MAFRKATRKQRKLRMAIDGPTGSGKTFTALAVASGLGGRTALIDTENRSAELYAHLFEFDVDQLTRHRPSDYVAKIQEAIKAGYDNVLVDSFSHAWMGREGALELVDRAAARTDSKNSFAAWREVTPEHNELVDTVIYAPANVIVTMRSKMAYELVDEGGKRVPKKLGLQPIQRDGLEYEFDLVGDMTMTHDMAVSKHRFHGLDLELIRKPGPALGKMLIDWLNSGEADELALARERRRVWEAIKQCRVDLGDDVFAAVVGSVEWRPKDLDDAKFGLGGLERARQGLVKDVPPWEAEDSEPTDGAAEAAEGE